MKTGNQRDFPQLIAELEQARERISDAGRQEAVARQHARGKMTARERIAKLCDPGSFREYGGLVKAIEDNPYNQNVDAPADGIITGTGLIDGMPVTIAANDYTVLGGSLGTIGMHKFIHSAQRAGDAGMPYIMLQEGGGHRIQDGLDSRHFAMGFSLWNVMAKMSGWVPIVSAVMGPGFAAATNFSAIADFVVMIRGQSAMGMAGPALVKAGTGETIGIEELGGAHLQADKNGIAHLAVDSEEECLASIRRYLSYLPKNASMPAPRVPTDDPADRRAEELLSVVPVNLRQGYDVRKVVNAVADRGSVFEIHPTHARNIVVAFARLDGQAVGILANNPMQSAGMLDAPACEKAAHFIAVCDAFGLPLIYLVDVPGFAIGSNAEATSLGRRSGRMLYELGCSTVPRLSVVMRKGYSGAFCAMNGGRPSFDADACYVWPTAEISALSVEGAVDVVYRKDYQNAPDPAAKRQAMIDEFKQHLGALRSVEHYFIDDVIDPRDTRAVLIRTLKDCPPRHKTHGFPKHRSISPI
jgi:acetyl-CoA carboxylase carboxyltransferase component